MSLRDEMSPDEYAQWKERVTRVDSTISPDAMIGIADCVKRAEEASLTPEKTAA